jgi:NADH dehydrogenase/NADH:ubiquinone oxidoreductase subunit G
MVEMRRPEWQEGGKLVAACEHPAQNGLSVSTTSSEVLLTRRTVLELLLARCPESLEVRALARQHGVTTTAFVARQDADLCVLCALCTRACAAVGTSAISTVGRGVDKKVGLPHGTDASACIGCLACARLCPSLALEWASRPTRNPPPPPPGLGPRVGN